MKPVKIMSALALFGIIFFGGYITGKFTTNEATREIAFGFDNKDNPGQINFNKSITDTEDQGTIDKIMMIYMHKKPIPDQQTNLGNPDTYLHIKSPKQSTLLIDSKLWFTNKGAIIGLRAGEDWEQTEYFSIDKDDANYLKEQMDEQ